MHERLHKTAAMTAEEGAESSRLPRRTRALSPRAPLWVRAQGAQPVPLLQAKLRVSQPGDPFEREADRAAEAVLRESRGDAHAATVQLHASPPAIQREEVCEADPYAELEGVYDEELGVCYAPEPAPEDDPIDGEFWLVPPNIHREDLTPIYDEETNAIVGFKYGGSYWEIYDLEGNLVETGEVGLESPLIDPIDILAGGLTGLFRGGARAAGGAAIRGAAGRGAASGALRAGLVVAAKTLGRHALNAVRATYRAIRFRGLLNFTGTTAARMVDPARRVPHYILKLAIQYGKRVPDPRGVPGAFQYTIQMFRNGKEYVLEVVLRESDQTVLHFLYK